MPRPKCPRLECHWALAPRLWKPPCRSRRSWPLACGSLGVAVGFDVVQQCKAGRSALQSTQCFALLECKAGRSALHCCVLCIASKQCFAIQASFYSWTNVKGCAREDEVVPCTPESEACGITKHGHHHFNTKALCLQHSQVTVYNIRHQRICRHQRI